MCSKMYVWKIYFSFKYVFTKMKNNNMATALNILMCPFPSDVKFIWWRVVNKPSSNINDIKIYKV